jgi:hypothetical protein
MKELTTELVEQIKVNPEKHNWYELCSQYNLSEEFIREHKNLVYWGCISEYQKLSEEFIREHKELVNWWNISACQKLSESFIREHKELVDWEYISKYQKLSEEFIREHKDLVDWIYISAYQKLSESFIREFNLTIPENSWLYKSDQEKEEYIRSNTGYEIRDGKVVAYKTCRSDGYSIFNFQYLYKVGNEYESHADYNPNNENSFGLSAWTKEGAIKYCSDGRLFEVEIPLEDLACVVHDGKKIRASKMRIVKELEID